MKRLLTLVITIIITTGISAAQYVSVSYSSDRGYLAPGIKKEIRELRNFEHQLDKFSYYLMVEDLYRARIAKRIIIEDMNREIRQTRQKLRMANRGYDTPDYRDQRGQIYSKRNGDIRRRSGSYEERILADRLAYQRVIRNEFAETPLVIRNRRKVLANKHRNLMYDFRDTLREEIGEIRNDERIVPRQRYRRG